MCALLNAIELDFLNLMLETGPPLIFATGTGLDKFKLLAA